MRGFHRYLLWEVGKLFLVALLIFTITIMLVGVVQQLLSQGLGPMAIVELLPYVLPISLQFALPATLLFAVCSVFGRIAADNEILALLAAGVTPWRFIAPTLIASFLLSLVAVWLNDIAVSWGRPGIHRVVMHSIEQVVYGYLATQGSYSSAEGFSIHVHGIGPDGRELIRPTISTPPRRDGGSVEITARSARLAMDPVAEELRIELVDSEVRNGKWMTSFPDELTWTIKLSDATRKGTARGHPTELPMRSHRRCASRTRRLTRPRSCWRRGRRWGWPWASWNG